MITFKGTKPLKDYDSVSLAARLRKNFSESYPSAEVSRLEDAIQVASYLHRGDVRRGARGKLLYPPYIEHPLRVALRMMETFDVKAPHLILAAILHDTVEDHPYEFSEFEGVSESFTAHDAHERALGFISEKFGYKVAAAVDLVSNPLLPKDITKTEKVQKYHSHVKAVVDISPSALIIKASDFVDNAGSLHHHYRYDDPKVTYFLDRYESLIPVYLLALSDIKTDLFDSAKVSERVKTVEEEFQRFRAALDNRVPTK